MQLYTNQVPQHIADVVDPSTGCNGNLSDDALTAGGLVKVSAYMRTEASSNAKRLKKAREKAADSGMRQINVVVPLAAHPALKAIAKELQTGGNLCKALENLLVAEVRAGDPDAVVQVVNGKQVAALERLAGRLTALTGWRRLLTKLLGLL